MREKRARLLPPREARDQTEVLARAAVTALAHQRFGFLSQLVEPTKGLCLRPSKGSGCRMMDQAELAACATSAKREEWSEDTGLDRGPRYTCAEAFANIFLGRDFRAPTAVHYNCFPRYGRGNNSSSVVASTAGRIYVEYYAAEHEPAHFHDKGMPWRALWLVFDGSPGQWHLTELISEYWGI